jgi:ankyrin repeat protein
MAARAGLEKVVARLLDLGLDIDARTGLFRFTALHAAAEEGHDQVVALLLSRGAKINALQYSDGLGTPLYLAVKNGHVQVARQLLPAGAKATLHLVDRDGFNLLHFASCRGHTEAVQLLLDWKMDENARTNDGCTPIMFAAHHGHVEAVKTLIAAKAKLDFADRKGETALMKAINKKHTVIVGALIYAGAKLSAPGSEGLPALELAAKCQHPHMFQGVLEAHSLDQIAMACEYNQVGALKHLLYGRALAASSLKRHPLILHRACEQGFEEVVEQLLEHCVSPNITDPQGQRPLHKAAQQGKGHQLFHYVIAHGAELDAVDKEGKTALFVASERGLKENVLALLRAGARADILATNGSSPLSIALNRNHAELVPVLARQPPGIDAVRAFLHNNPTAWRYEARDALILYLVDSRQLLPPARRACSPATQSVVDEALERFADQLRGADPARLAISSVSSADPLVLGRFRSSAAGSRSTAVRHRGTTAATDIC